MVTWDESTYRNYEQRSKAAVHAGSPGPAGQLESNPGSVPLGQGGDKKTNTAKLHLRFIHVRKRLCDPDNCCIKYLLDAMRYAQIIPGDEPEKITVEIEQRKAAAQEAEQTIVEVYERNL